MRNRGIGRASMFLGGMLLAAAVVVWATAILMSPHGSASGGDSDHVRTSVALFLRNTALGTLLLTALAAYLLFPKRRPRWPRRDLALIAVIAVLIVSSAYQLIWVQTLG